MLSQTRDCKLIATGCAAKQDEFLKALAASGVQAAVKSREIKNYDGTSAAKIDLRYTLVYNGVALSVPASAIPVIEGMPQVKKSSEWFAIYAAQPERQLHRRAEGLRRGEGA